MVFIGPELAALVALTIPDFALEDALDLDVVKEILEEERVVTPDIIGKKQDNE